MYSRVPVPHCVTVRLAVAMSTRKSNRKPIPTLKSAEQAKQAADKATQKAARQIRKSNPTPKTAEKAEKKAARKTRKPNPTPKSTKKAEKAEKAEKAAQKAARKATRKAAKEATKKEREAALVQSVHAELQAEQRKKIEAQRAQEKKEEDNDAIDLCTPRFILFVSSCYSFFWIHGLHAVGGRCHICQRDFLFGSDDAPTATAFDVDGKTLSFCSQHCESSWNDLQKVQGGEKLSDEDMQSDTGDSDGLSSACGETSSVYEMSCMTPDVQTQEKCRWCY